MKTLFFGFFMAITLLFAAATGVNAQITSIAQFYFTAYSQSGPAPATAPDYPNSYYFGVTLYSDPNYAISLPMVFTPSETTDGEFIMSENGYATYNFGSPIYSDTNSFNSDYPPGEYDYFVDYPDVSNNIISEDVYLEVPADSLFSPVIPAFLPTAWTGMQSLDPAVDFPLSWASYTATPGADYAYTFIGSYDNQTFNSAYGGFNFSCPPQITNTVIPAGSFDYGRSYTLQLYYSNRLTPAATNADGSSVNVTIGFDNVMHTTVITIPPPLQINLASPGVTLTWPSLATNYKLQRTHSLAVPHWTDITNAPAVLSGTNALTFPATNSSGFFRLAPI